MMKTMVLVLMLLTRMPHPTRLLSLMRRETALVATGWVPPTATFLMEWRLIPTNVLLIMMTQMLMIMVLLIAMMIVLVMDFMEVASMVIVERAREPTEIGIRGMMEVVVRVRTTMVMVTIVMMVVLVVLVQATPLTTFKMVVMMVMVMMVIQGQATPIVVHISAKYTSLPTTPLGQSNAVQWVPTSLDPIELLWNLSSRVWNVLWILSSAVDCPIMINIDRPARSEEGQGRRGRG